MTWIRRRPTSILDVGAEWHLQAEPDIGASAFARSRLAGYCGSSLDPQSPDLERTEDVPIEPGGLDWDVDRIRSRICPVCLGGYRRRVTSLLASTMADGESVTNQSRPLETEGGESVAE